MFGTYLSPFGNVSFETTENALTKMWFGNLNQKEDQHDFIQLVKHELDNYFMKKSKIFNIPLAFNGTPFQMKVLNELIKIPYGQTKTYKEIAYLIGSNGGYQAIGQACKRNPIGIVIPCHRVIGSNGQLTGYSGKEYIHLKEMLLHFESEKK